MNPFLGPLDQDGRIPAHQQTRVAAFLMSAHGAQARRLAAALPGHLRSAGQVELHDQFSREMQILSFIARATSWAPDPMLPFLIWEWEVAWLPRPAEGAADQRQGLLIDLAAFGHALYTGLRPAALLPEAAAPLDPFALAMRHIELESGRLMQPQLLFLRGLELFSVRDAVSAAVDRRHSQIRQLWTSMLHGIDVDTSNQYLVETAYASMMRDDKAKGDHGSASFRASGYSHRD